MNINEIDEELEQQFGKPRNITEENVLFLMSLIVEQVDGASINKEVERPSPDAYAMMIMAVMQYPTIPWEELAKKPAIRRSFKFVAVKCKDHYAELDKLTKEVMNKHLQGVTRDIGLAFLKIIRALSKEECPSKLIEHTPFPAHFEAIINGLHKLIQKEHPDDAAAIIHCAINDGILNANTQRSLVVDEFNLKKSSFDKYFTKYRDGQSDNNERIRKETKARIDYHQKTLRNTIGYTVGSDGNVQFYDRKLGSRSLLNAVIAYCRTILNN